LIIDLALNGGRCGVDQLFRPAPKAVMHLATPPVVV
jgi:hypothetical protein